MMSPVRAARPSPFAPNEQFVLLRAARGGGFVWPPSAGVGQPRVPAEDVWPQRQARVRRGR